MSRLTQNDIPDNLPPQSSLPYSRHLLQCNTTCLSAMQCQRGAVRCSILQCVVCCSILEFVAVSCSVMQCVKNSATDRRIRVSIKCVAACCSVSHYVAMRNERCLAARIPTSTQNPMLQRISTSSVVQQLQQTEKACVAQQPHQPQQPLLHTSRNSLC